MATSEEAETPLMKQYHRIKDEHQDAILMFRLGDFYEMFFDDAEVAARILEVTLTSKPVGKDVEVPMAGIPVHSVNSYVDQLIDAGHRVAICEQVEDADASSGVVEREVVRVMTPGTMTEEEYLESNENNYLLSFVVDEPPETSGRERVGLAYVDLSTGEFHGTQFEEEDEEGVLESEINRLQPSEILVPDEELHEERLEEILEYHEDIAVARRPGWEFEPDETHRKLEEEFDAELLEDVNQRDELIRAAGGLVFYLDETQRQTLSHLDRLTPYEREKYMILDATSQRNLELVESLTGQQEATLLNVLDETETAMGSRRLRHWILQPLLNRERILDRQQGIQWLVDHPDSIETLNEELRQVYDIQRIVGKIGSNRANPRDVLALRDSLDRIPDIKSVLPDEGIFETMKGRLHHFEDLRRELHDALVDDPAQKLSEGGIIKDGYSDQLDEYREAMRGGKDWIANLQEEERERTGIDSLKVGHNKVHGYYIEVTKANTDAVPDNYERRQTLTNSERYVTPELKEKEQVIFGAEEKSHALEEELFLELREMLVEELDRLKDNAEVLADLDVLCCLAEVARERNYVRPEVDWGEELYLEEGRHPVVEEIHEEEFVPNGVELDDDDRIVVLTGPNMSGKSTYIRQVALISIMAQMGSFVPADEARIGMIDRVFTRVGAHDFLAGGQSTFMVEMSETADIVNNATERSLLILDEVGRGTSTYDGLAIARSVIEFIAERIQARTLFATHYHELTQLADEYEEIFNLTVRAREWNDEIIFLRQVEEGAADQSYGIEVGKLAGLPDTVIQRARTLLRELEDSSSTVQSRTSQNGRNQMDLFSPPQQVADSIKELDLENLTPLDALQRLQDFQDRLQKDEDDE
jgi:DNA mismatch repair protein MutS